MLVGLIMHVPRLGHRLFSISHCIIQSLVPASPHRLLCCVDASLPASFQVKARYAIEMLLNPLGVTPQWVAVSNLGAQGLYYGPHPPSQGVAVQVAAYVVEYFQQRQVYRADEVQWDDWEGASWPILFRQADGNKPDLIASAFFWLSGWQEYTTSTSDAHGRFPYAASLQAQWGVAMAPPVDAYRKRLATQLETCGVRLYRRAWQGKRWAFCSTHDIDYLKKWRKGMVWREVVQYLLLNHQQVRLPQRVQRFAHFLHQWAQPGDVYRTSFQRIASTIKATGGSATFFLKAGVTSPHDVYYPLTHSFLRRQIPELADHGIEFGLHPSYYAHTRLDALQAEKQRLEAVLPQPALSVRQHYLRYERSLTSRLHQHVGFAIDSTLGFADWDGFRHGTCVPFQVFDCEGNEALSLWEMPLAIMDGNLFVRRRLSLEDALTETRAIMDVCKRFRGACVVLWHNTLWDELDYPAWGAHFEWTIHEALEQQAVLLSLQAALDSWEVGT